MNQYEQKLKILRRDLEDELIDEMRRCISTPPDKYWRNAANGSTIPDTETRNHHIDANIDLTDRALMLSGAYGIVVSVLESED